MAGCAATVFSTVLTFVLWFCSILVLRLTPLTGAALLLASLGLTVCLAALAWLVLTLWERTRQRTGHRAGRRTRHRAGGR